MAKDNNILNIQNSEFVNIYHEGEITTYDSNDAKLFHIMNLCNKMIASGREMPALGVSIHNDTVCALNTGLYFEICYNKVQEHNGLPYKRLLFKVEKSSTGLNIIRFYNDKYEGRCFYIDLESDMNMLYKAIIDILR